MAEADKATSMFRPVNAPRLTFLSNPHRYGETVGPHHTIVLPTVERMSEWAPYGNRLINITIDTHLSAVTMSSLAH